MLKMILCIDLNYAIGYQNKCLYEFPEDRKFFRETTKNSVVIMGRNTFDSIGKPLPNRINVVLTTNVDAYRDKVDFVAKDLSELRDLIKKFNKINSNVFIIGGERLYREFYKEVDELYVTLIDQVSKDYDATVPMDITCGYPSVEIINTGYSENYDADWVIYKYSK